MVARKHLMRPKSFHRIFVLSLVTQTATYFPGPLSIFIRFVREKQATRSRSFSLSLSLSGLSRQHRLVSTVMGDNGISHICLWRCSRQVSNCGDRSCEKGWRCNGDVIRKGFYQSKHVEHKGQVDLVTETDKDCEELIFNHLKKHFPYHKFIGEEASASLGTAELTDDPTWIVDPLDGTTNFVHGFSFVCVSIGLTIGKVPTVGVIFNPIINEIYYKGAVPISLYASWNLL